MFVVYFYCMYVFSSGLNTLLVYLSHAPPSLSLQVWPVTALTTDGSTKMKGDHKRTYEVVRDEGSYSYDLEKIPGYSILILAWKEVGCCDLFVCNHVCMSFLQRSVFCSYLIVHGL